MPARLMAVLATPLTVVVKLFPAKLLEMEFTIGTDVPVTPFTVVVRLLADDVLEIEFIMGTVVALTPFTVVVKLLTDEVLTTALTALLVAATPFTVLVSVLPDKAKVLVVAGKRLVRFKGALVIPFTVVVKLPPDILLDIVLMIGTDAPVMPFTVVVKTLFDDTLETELTMGTAVPVIPLTVVVKLLGALLVLLTDVDVVIVAGAHAFPFQVSTCPLLAPVVVPNGEPFIFETTDIPRLPVTSPATAAVNGVLAMPLTVLMS